MLWECCNAVTSKCNLIQPILCNWKRKKKKKIAVNVKSRRQGTWTFKLKHLDSLDEIKSPARQNHRLSLAQSPSLKKERERGRPTPEELRAERKELGKWTKGPRRSGRRERQRRENEDKARACVLFVKGQWLRVTKRVSLRSLSSSVQPICSMDPLTNSEQNKSGP